MLVRTLCVGLLAAVMAGCAAAPAAPDVALDPAAPAATNVPEATTPASSSPLAGTKWRLEAYGPEAAPHATLVTSAVTLEFDAAQVGGSLGCNQFGGPYTVEGQSLAIPQMNQTAMACGGEIDQQEQQVGKALLAVQRYSIEGDTLRLVYPDGVLRYARAQAAPDLPLDGTTWQLTSVISGSAAHSPVANTQITAQFAAGRVAGTAGCNSYSGGYTTQGSALAVGNNIISTKKACAADVMQQEQAFLDALAASTGYTISGNQLTLTHAGGQLVFTAA